MGRTPGAPDLASGLDAEQQRRIEELQAIGYLAGSRPPSGESGVVRDAPERVSPGLNFYVSGHAPEALLMDREGRVLHRWRRAFEEVWPERVVPDLKEDSQFWRKALLLPDGAVVAIHEGLGILKIDRDSRVQWAFPYPAHHDLALLPSGDIALLTREAHLAPHVDPRQPILEDYISLLGPDGRERRRISLLAAFERSEPAVSWRALSREFWERERTRSIALFPEDLFHANAIELLDGAHAARLPAFQAGSFLVSLAHLDSLVVVDPREERVVWCLAARTALQHAPSLTRAGDLLVFDNHWRRGHSRVVRLDPLTGKTRWQWDGFPGEPLYSHTCGTVRELANGNLLVVESDNGRALEVTPGGEVVWEFRSPHRAGPGQEFVATLFDMVRVAPGFTDGWLSPAR